MGHSSGAMNFFAKTCSFHGDRCHEEKRKKKKKPIKQLQEGKPHHHATALNQRAGTEPGQGQHWQEQVTP